MNLATWRRAMISVGAVLVLAGAAMMVGGGLYAGRQQYSPGGDVMTEIWVGTFGTLGVVLGVVLLKLGLMGPYPRELSSQAPPEAKD